MWPLTAMAVGLEPLVDSFQQSNRHPLIMRPLLLEPWPRGPGILCPTNAQSVIRRSLDNWSLINTAFGRGCFINTSCNPVQSEEPNPLIGQRFAYRCDCY